MGTPVSFTEANSYVTVAGQTSLGGITFAGDYGSVIGNYNTDFHDGVFRHLRFRGNGNYDNIAFNRTHHLVFDHCDFSGGTDETLDITYGHDITIQWSTIANSDTSGQNYGSLIAYQPTNRYSIHHTLNAHHSDRCMPHMHWGDGAIGDEGVTIDYRNNVVYNCSFDAGMYLAGVGSGAERMSFNVIGNYLVRGPDSPTEGFMFALVGGANMYVDDNKAPGAGIFSPFRALTTLSAPAAAPPVVTHAADEGLELVLNFVGAYPRDAMTARVVQETRTGTGQMGQLDDALLSGGAAAPTDSDSDGMPDVWEMSLGLNPKNPDDSATDPDKNGYSSIEDYVEELTRSLGP